MVQPKRLTGAPDNGAGPLRAGVLATPFPPDGVIRRRQSQPGTFGMNELLGFFRGLRRAGPLLAVISLPGIATRRPRRHLCRFLLLSRPGRSVSKSGDTCGPLGAISIPYLRKQLLGCCGRGPQGREIKLIRAAPWLAGSKPGISGRFRGTFSPSVNPGRGLRPASCCYQRLGWSVRIRAGRREP